MIITGIQEKNLELIKEFAKTTYWLPEHAHFFDEHFTLELPFAPPGWFQDLNEYETRTHFAWLNRSVKNWGWANTEIYATNYPDVFWIIRDGEGDVCWNARKGRFHSRFLTRITVSYGKIGQIRDHFDNNEVYRAAGIPLPLFHYDAPPAETMPERAHAPVLTEKEAEENALAAIASMVLVDFWEDDGTRTTLADDFVHRLPFTPEEMPKEYTLREYDALNVWLQKNTRTWDVYPGTILYETDHPGEFIIESGGSGIETWSGCPDGFYQNRHVSFLRIRNGYAVEFDEYFDPTKKFNSINISIPSFPYLF